MATRQGQVTKIYELKTIGHKDVVKELDILTKKFEQVKKAKNDALKEKARVKNQDSKEVEELNKKIQKEIELERQLTLEIKKKIAERRKQKLVEEAAKNAEFSEGLIDNSIRKAKAENTALRKERENLNAATAEGRQRIDEINAAIDRNNDFIKENSSLLEKQRLNIGNYEGSAKIIVDALEKARQKVQQVETQFGQMSPEANAARHEFQSLERITENPQFLNVAAKVGDANAELRQFTKILVDLERRGLGSSETANRLRDQLARLTDEIKDTRAEVRALSSDTRTFDVVASGISTFTSSLQTAAGVSALFGDSQEEVQRKMAFLLAVENTANGVRAIANDLTTRGTAANKLYAFVQGQVAVATNASAAAGARAVAVMKLFAVAATVIGAIVVAFIALNSRISEAAQRQKDLNEVIKEASNSYGEAIAQVQELRTNIELAKKGFISKKEVVSQYNDTIGKATGEVKTLDEAEIALAKNAEKYIEFMFLKAQATAAYGFAAKLAAEQVEDLFTPEERTQATQIGLATGVVSESQVRAEEERQQADRQKRFEDRIKQIFDFATGKSKAAAELAKKFGFDFFGDGDDKEKTNQEKDALARIDAIRDRSLAEEQRRVLEIRKVRELTLEEEIAHLRNMERISQKALTDKAAYLSNKKSKDGEDLKQIAEFNREKVQLELSTLDEIQKLRDKEFEERSAALKEQLERDIEAQQKSTEEFLSDPNASEEAKANRKLAADLKILELQKQFNSEMLALERFYTQASVENAEARAVLIRDTEQDIKQDFKDILLSRVQDLQAAGQSELRQIQLNFSNERQAILSNTSLSDRKRKELIDKLNKAERRTILSAEIERLLKEVEIKKELLSLNLIAEAEYQQALLDLQKKFEELQASTTEDLEKRGFGFQKMFRKLFNIEEGSEEDAALGRILAESYNVATLAMNNYFDAEQARIRESLDLQLERLEMEQEQVTARAQSQAEIESIEKQFAARKRAAEREAYESLRKSRRAQARIAFAVELANIAVQASQYPFPASLVIGGILASIAAVKHALNMAAINREKFAKGGQVEKKGGQAGGKSHAQGGYPFNYEAERGELFIVNKRSAADNRVRTFRGTNKQVASMINELGGGVSFAGGGQRYRFAQGAALGGSLSAPVYTPGTGLVFPGSGAITEKLDEVIDSNRQFAEEMAARVDRIEVVQQTSTVTEAQRKIVKQTSIGSF